MVKCHICGQQTDSGSVCRHCRAALNRLRERAAPSDARGFMSLAVASTAGAAALGGTFDAAHSGVIRRRKPKPAAAHAPGAAAATDGAPANAPATPKATPRWLSLVGLLAVVSVAALAVYQLVTAGAPPAPAPIPRIEGGSNLDPARILATGDAGPGPAVAPSRESVPVVAPASAPTPAAGPAAEPVRVAAPPPSRVAEATRPKHAAEAPRSSDASRTARPAALASSSSAGAASTHAGPVTPADASMVDATPRGTPGPAPRTAAVPTNRGPALAVAPAAAPQARAPAASRWELMDAALEECSRRELLGRVVCREKVKLEYCQGQWGQTPRCPGNMPMIEHGS